MSEICKNCGKVIGNLETPHLFKNHVVCTPCLRKLRAEAELVDDLPRISASAADSTARSSAATSIYDAPGQSSQSSSSAARKSVPQVPLQNPGKSIGRSSPMVPDGGNLPSMKPVVVNIPPMAGAIPMPIPSARTPLGGSSFPPPAMGYAPKKAPAGETMNVFGLVALLIGTVAFIGSGIPFTGLWRDMGMSPSTILYTTMTLAGVGIGLGIFALIQANQNPRMNRSLATLANGLSALALTVCVGLLVYGHYRAESIKKEIVQRFEDRSRQTESIVEENRRQAQQDYEKYQRDMAARNAQSERERQQEIAQRQQEDEARRQAAAERQAAMKRAQEETQARLDAASGRNTSPGTPRIPPTGSSSSTPGFGSSSSSGTSTYVPPVYKPTVELDIHSEGAVVVDDVTISYASMKPLGVAVRPRNLSGSGEVLAITLKVSVSPDAKAPVTLDNPQSQPKLTIKGETATAFYITSEPSSVTLKPGDTKDMVLYFPYPKIRNVDLAIELPGGMFENSRGTVEILLPKGSNYRPKPTTRPATSQPAKSAGTPEEASKPK